MLTIASSPVADTDIAYAAFRILFNRAAFDLAGLKARGELVLRWGKLMRWALLIARVFYYSRIVALPYLYLGLSGLPFGWNIPVFNFMGFIGWFENPELQAGSTAMSRLAALGVVGSLVACFWMRLILGRFQSARRISI